MSRIRSVHPSLFTDEEFMCLSPHAQVLLIGIWTECDDQGVFAWKPMTLKARLLPAASVDIPGILEEIAQARFIRQYTVDGKAYGAVRNFRKFQRPKAPSAVHPLPHDMRTYVGLKPYDTETTPSAGEPFPQEWGNATEKPAQRYEVVVGEGVVGGDNTTAASRASADGTEISIPPPDGTWTKCHYEELDRLLFDAAGPAANRTTAGLQPGPIIEAINGGCDLHLDILPTIKARCARMPPGKLRSWSFLVEDSVSARNRRIAARSATESTKPPPTTQPTTRNDPYKTRVSTEDIFAALSGGDR